MGSNRDLKAFVRYDGSGRVVAGSLILRKKKPTVGNWQQVQGYECCNGVTISHTPVDVSLPSIALEIGCADSGIGYTYVYIDVETLTVQDVIAALNANAPFIGKFSLNVNGTSIDLNVNLDVVQAAACTPYGSLAFTVITGA
jgi:hypothetical protein